MSEELTPLEERLAIAEGDRMLNDEGRIAEAKAWKQFRKDGILNEYVPANNGDIAATFRRAFLDAFFNL